jgi:hypothetical protein
VTQLLQQLVDDLSQPALSISAKDSLLEQLKVLCRDPKNSQPIFSEKGISTLLSYAIDTTSKTTSQNSLRCLANALLLNPASRQLFLELKGDVKLCDSIEWDDYDNQFLVARTLFLGTYTGKMDIDALVSEHHLQERIVSGLQTHAQKQPPSSMAAMALPEILKLLFNLTHFHTPSITSFAPATPHIITILLRTPIPAAKPTDPPISSLINALLNLTASELSIPLEQAPALANRLLEILDKGMTAYSEADSEAALAPLVTLLRKFHSLAPADVQTTIREKLLPSPADREQPLGKGVTLPHRILRLSTAALAPTLREEISSLLYEMSDSDPKTFTKNIGYGFASGILFNKGIALPQEALESLSIAEGGTEGGASVKGKGKEKEKEKAPERQPGNKGGKPINPVTGQTLETEREPAGPKMTKAEKEREAERLMVLFERYVSCNLVAKCMN